MNIHDLILQTKDNPDLLTIEATVITGFEFLAQDECREKCKPSSIVKTKGRIFFNIPAADFNKVLTLRSVDNVFLVTETIKEISFDENKDNDLNIVKSFVEVVNWEKCLSKWQSISGFKGIIYPPKKETVKSEVQESVEAVDVIKRPTEIRVSENVIKESVGENIFANTSDVIKIETENKKSADTDIAVDCLRETCVSVNQVTSNSIELGNISKTDSNPDYINLEDNACASSSLDNIVHDLVSKIDIKNKDNDCASSDHKVNPEDTSNWEESSVAQESECPLDIENKENDVAVSGDYKVNPEDKSTCEESSVIDVQESGCPISVSTEAEVPLQGGSDLACGNMELNKVDDKTIQDDSHGNDIEGPEKCSPNLADIQPTKEKRQFRGRNVQGGRDNNAKPRGKRLQRIKKNEVNTGILKFRATCYRVGGKHSFSSMEAACEFGGTLQDKFGWTVDLTQFDLNVILNIEKNQAYICIALTDESLHRRNITHFNNTTLRATMCYNLFRLAEPMTGEIVIDPLCGGGSISIEGSLSFPNTYHICGDYNDKAVERTRANIHHICQTKNELKVGAVKWNAKSLPLRSQSVDVLVSDLPFGRRSGSKQDNQRLYSSVLYELAKVIRTGTGRACLLTYDRTSLTRALRSTSTYWREIRQFGVNQGGLFSTVFLLLRRATPVPEKTDVALDIPLKSNSDVAPDKSEITKSNQLEDNIVLSVEITDKSLQNGNASPKEKQLSAAESDVALEENIPLDDTVLKTEKFEDITLQNDDSSKNTKQSLAKSHVLVEEGIPNKNNCSEISATQSLPCEGKNPEDVLVLSVEVANIALENLSRKDDRLCEENVTEAEKIPGISE